MSPAGAELQLSVESQLPDRVVVGRGALLLVHGWCFHPRKGVRRLRILAGGDAVRPIASGMPRPDVLDRLAPELRENAYRSGFWALVPLGPVEAHADVELSLEAELGGGGSATRKIGDLRLEPAPAQGPQPGPAGEPEEMAQTFRYAKEKRHSAVTAGLGSRQPPGANAHIAICMATFDPPPELFRAQIESIREQTQRNWSCLICDDGSQPEALELIEQTVGDDPRFRVERGSRRLGFHRNFERALGLLPAEAELVALADQDDRWFPEKLEELAGELGGDATLAYSDARIVREDGGVVSPTFWTARPNNHTDLGRLVLVNSITGAASLFRRELLDYVLPFPPPAPESLHDHWIGMVALSLGRVAYVDRPLYDYVQHSAAAHGHSISTNPRHPEGQRPEPDGLEDGPPRDESGRWRLELFARLRRNYPAVLRVRRSAGLLLLRGAEGIPARKRRKLRRLAALEGSPAALGWLGWLAVRSFGRRSPTLRVERMLLAGTAWRWLVSAVKRLRLPPPDPEHQSLALLMKPPLDGELPATGDRMPSP